jgi:hypothetical protein
MPIRLVKCLCIAVLFVAFVLWHWMADYEFPLGVAVCLGGAVVAVQAFHSIKHHWTMYFRLIVFESSDSGFSVREQVGPRCDRARCWSVRRSVN